MIREIAKFGILPVMSLTMMTACGQEPDAPTDEVTVLTGARLIDGNGGPPIENAVLVIRGERLEEVGSATEVTVPAGAEVVEVEVVVIGRAPSRVRARAPPMQSAVGGRRCRRASGRGRDEAGSAPPAAPPHLM